MLACEIDARGVAVRFFAIAEHFVQRTQPVKALRPITGIECRGTLQ
jgi:hypothetical protein